jgi:hypothetical protein
MCRVSLRRLVTAASTLVVAIMAIVLAICVPVSQLHTIGSQTECCCPDPDQCKCPDHNEDTQTQPSMRACHKTQHDFVAPVLPAFIAPTIELAIVLEPVGRPSELGRPEPHPAPAPRRPDAPS